MPFKMAGLASFCSAVWPKISRSSTHLALSLRIILSRLQVPVSISQIKQIAGRAGRRNSIYPKGYATTLQAADLPRVKAAVDAPMSALGTQAAGLFPEFQHLELLGGQVGADPLDLFLILEATRVVRGAQV